LPANYAEAANLLSAKVMAKPLKQMPYQTVGDLFLDFPAVKPWKIIAAI
jgi:alpha-L-fucosidase 2